MKYGRNEMIYKNIHKNKHPDKKRLSQKTQLQDHELLTISVSV